MRCLAILAALLLLAAPSLAAPAGDPVRVIVERDGVRSEVRTLTGPDGARRLGIVGADGSTQELTPDEFTTWLATPGERSAWYQKIFNVRSSRGLAWVMLGFLGQALFTGRMLVQWLASERLGRSHVPTVFWWLSLAGSSVLVAYFFWRRDAVGVLGQSVGLVVYVRNLLLIRNAARNAS